MFVLLMNVMIDNVEIINTEKTELKVKRQNEQSYDGLLYTKYSVTSGNKSTAYTARPGR